MAKRTPKRTKKRATRKKAKAPAHLLDRVALLRKRLAETGADALLVSNRPDVRYLTGFHGEDSWALVTTKSNQVTIISDSRLEEQIANEAPHCGVLMRKKGLGEELPKLLEKKKVEILALPAEHTTLAAQGTIARGLGAYWTEYAVDIEDLSDDEVAERKADQEATGMQWLETFDTGMLKQRAVKTADEIKAIRTSLDIQQEAYRTLLGEIEPGMMEYEVAALLEYHMRRLGADGTSFPSIVAADANASMPHAIPGKAKIKQGGIVLIDWGAKWGGYCSDLTRTIGIGSMSKKMREVYAIVLEAQQAGIEAIGPGVKLKDVDQAARDVIKKAGYDKQFGHGLGHGIGLDIHEQPTLSKRAEGELKPGHVVTVEPGIYLPGIGGVRIEDDVLVTEDGFEVLSSLPSDLDSAII